MYIRHATFEHSIGFLFGLRGSGVRSLKRYAQSFWDGTRGFMNENTCFPRAARSDFHGSRSAGLRQVLLDVAGRGGLGSGFRISWGPELASYLRHIQVYK